MDVLLGEANGIAMGPSQSAPDLRCTCFSVDVVDMNRLRGPAPHPSQTARLIPAMPHRGPGGVRWGLGAGWKVYSPGSAHFPDVGEGRALVLYSLPGGRD